MPDLQPESNGIVKYHEFAKDPEAAIDTLNETGQPIVITGHDQFLFKIEPLDTELENLEDIT